MKHCTIINIPDTTIKNDEYVAQEYDWFFFVWMNLENIRWSLQESGATEGLTFYMSLENGGFALMQVVYSTMSWSPSVQMSCRYYTSDGKTYAKSYNAYGTSFQPSNDNRSFVCDDVSIKMLGSGSGYEANFKTSEWVFSFTYVPSVPGFPFSDGGSVSLGGEEASGDISATFFPKGRVTGHFMVKGQAIEMVGDALFTYAMQIKPQNVGQWNFVNFQAKDASIMMYKIYKPTPSSIGSLVVDDKVIALTRDNTVIHQNCRMDDFSGYEVPAKITFNWTGTSAEQENVSVELVLTTARLCDKVDVLNELPYLIKVFIQTFITAPYIYHWYEEATAVVSIGGVAREIKGNLFVETSFLGVVQDNIEIQK